MKTQVIEIQLPANTYISEIEPFKSTGIPTMCIIHKSVTGCGITTFEIRFAKHHSIIILPNVPVIKGKVKEHNRDYPGQEILGVHKGIDVNDIKAYLLTDVKYKKILTTPEGFISKVLKAFEKQPDTLINDYFLLYDECERIITDISYRGKIAAPLDIFFKFKNKALVSATTLPFSDQRFEEFTHYTIKPTYDCSKPLTVVNTNNVISSLKQQLDKLNSEHVCIFLNSTKGIYAVSDNLGLHSKSKAYCSQESVVSLMEDGYKHASSEFDAKDMALYNFFTSRYFSAVDIKLDYKPDVVLVTDIFFADHSILDPHTEVIQIAGRFRNGINSLTHITNYDATMETKTPEEALTYLEGCLDTYEHIVALLKKSNHKGVQDTLKFFLKESPIASFFTDGKRNSFMIDNDLNQERVKGYYKDKESLIAAYDEVADHFVTTYKDEEYPVGDGDMRTLKQTQTKKEKYQQVAKLLERYSAVKGGFIFLSNAAEEQKNILTRKYPLIAEVHRLIGLERLEATDYELAAIHKAIKGAKKINEIKRIQPFIHKVFAEHSIVYENDVVNKLTAIYEEHDVYFSVAASHIKRYFDARRSSQGKVNVWILNERLK